MLINRVQHFSLHDGPGIRTTIFMQGCNLRCSWCHNPETQPTEPSVFFDSSVCINCAACVSVCPNGAQKSTEGRHVFDTAKCTGCKKCIGVCFPKAMRENGYETDEDELIKELLRDRRWYELSGGGVTISGGEPMLQPMAVRSLSSKLRAAGIHVAVDTALCVPWEIVKILLDTTDLFLVDLKTIDASAHEKYTSRTNTDILKNIQRFPETSQIRIRIPVIGDVNDSDRDRERFLKLILGLGKKITAVDLLKYHNIGISKAARYGIEQPQFNAPTEDRMNAFLKAFGECSLHAHIG